MDLYKEILVNVLAKEKVQVTFPSLKLEVSEVVEMRCFKALQNIKAIIADDSLNDFECVDSIICILEEMGSGGGNRHDFG